MPIRDDRFDDLMVIGHQNEQEMLAAASIFKEIVTFPRGTPLNLDDAFVANFLHRRLREVLGRDCQVSRDPITGKIRADVTPPPGDHRPTFPVPPLPRDGPPK